MATSLVKKLKGDLTEYGSIPFWSWNNDLDGAELRRQIREMKAAGIGGFIMHARTGLVTEYLSEKWFSLIGECLDEARKQNMAAWVYDENGWPSGFVEGRLLSDDANKVLYLEYAVKDFYDPAAAAVYALGAGGAARRLAPGDKARAYHCVYIRRHDSFVDILDPRVVSQFIEATHEEYYKRFKDSFGRELKGFFTDEPQYFRYATPYSVVLPAEFKKAYGADVLDGLIYLFIQSEKGYAFRDRYFSLLSKLYCENFYKRLYDWCGEHNCLLTGHTVQESTLSGQLWCCAGAMPSYEYEHIPGIDWLARVYNDRLSPKQVGSAAQQLARPRVLTETFGCCGWDVTPRELRSLAEVQYVRGVNMMCHHLWAYSIAGQGRNDHPPSFSRQNPWIKDFKPFNDYFNRLGYILVNTRERADTLVVHPMKSAFLTYIREQDYKSVEEQEKNIAAYLEKLDAEGIQYHLGDEILIQKYGRTSGGVFKVGACAYTTVILPGLKSIGKRTAALLKKFAGQGGKVIVEDCAPVLIDGVRKMQTDWIKSTAALSGIARPYTEKAKKPAELTVCARGGRIGEFLYVYNGGVADENLDLQGSYELLDLVNPASAPAVFPVSVPAGEGIVLKQMTNNKSQMTNKGNNESDLSSVICHLSSDCELEITGDFKLAKPAENALTLDFVSWSADGVNYSKPAFVYAVAEKLIKSDYRGALYLKYAFNVRKVPRALTLRMEKMRFISLSVNGAEAARADTDWDVKFVEADISGSVRKGINEIVACIDYFQRPEVKYVMYDPDVMESLVNCLMIDTELESAFLLGGFGVDGGRTLTAQNKDVRMDAVTSAGYPNFAGDMVFKAEIDVTEPNSSLVLQGRYMAAKVSVNGRRAGIMLMSDTLDLSGKLKAGKNTLEIILTSSLRNQMGPLHFHAPCEIGVGTFPFNFRKTWTEDGKSPYFTDEYNY
ncbi:MAG: hypothetical protein FWE62_02910, partial [Firmicutes bacterium]|nr:hypothetical protein [Bacillota bacterium]